MAKIIINLSHSGVKIPLDTHPLRKAAYFVLKCKYLSRQYSLVICGHKHCLSTCIYRTGSNTITKDLLYIVYFVASLTVVLAHRKKIILGEL